MELLLRLAGLGLLICSAITSADGNGPAVIKVVVIERSDVILPCSLSTNIESMVFNWTKDGQKEVFRYDAGITGQDEQFKGRVSHFQDELKSGGASIIIRKTKAADSGDYTCDFPRLQPVRRAHIQLVVDRILKDRSEENIPGAAPKPYLTTLNQTEDGVLLQCVVGGASPEPKVEWQDSAGNILPAEEPQVSERGGRYDITLQTTVTKTDRYRCVVTQEDINHTIYSETFVPLSESPTESHTGWIVPVAVLGGVVVGVVLAVLVVQLCIKSTSNNG